MTHSGQTRSSSLLLACVIVLSSIAGVAQSAHPPLSAPDTHPDIATQKASAGPVDRKDPPVSSADTFVIGAGDILAINVWKDPEFSKTMPVRPDGKISLPVLGEVQAAGLTAMQLQQVIAERLQPYMRSPQVDVIVQEIKSRTFNVVGKILKPGAFDLTKSTTVLDAIALAGGFQDYARLTKVYVLRRSVDGRQVIIPFNYKQVVKGKHPEQNIELLPEDTVVVP